MIIPNLQMRTWRHRQVPAQGRTCRKHTVRIPAGSLELEPMLWMALLDLSKDGGPLPQPASGTRGECKLLITDAAYAALHPNQESHASFQSCSSQALGSLPISPGLDLNTGTVRGIPLGTRAGPKAGIAGAVLGRWPSVSSTLRGKRRTGAGREERREGGGWRWPRGKERETERNLRGQSRKRRRVPRMQRRRGRRGGEGRGDPRSDRGLERKRKKGESKAKGARAAWTGLLGDGREADGQGGVEKEGGRRKGERRQMHRQGRDHGPETWWGQKGGLGGRASRALTAG